MELDDFPRATNDALPSLGQLLKHVGDVRKETTGDGGETLAHHTCEIFDASLEPHSLPFVLSFNNLTYSVKVRHKFSLSGMLSSCNNRLSIATASDPISGGEIFFSKTRTLLNDISGEARFTEAFNATMLPIREHLLTVNVGEADRDVKFVIFWTSTFSASAARSACSSSFPFSLKDTCEILLYLEAKMQVCGGAALMGSLQQPMWTKGIAFPNKGLSLTDIHIC
ncbi:hypothetical protein FF1_018473 [Malus domestica]